MLNRVYVFVMLLCTGLLFTCYNPRQKVPRPIPDPAHPIVGNWKVVHTTFSPFEHISYCKKLEVGAVFRFLENKKLLVYKKGEKDHCNHDQTYRVDATSIELLEWDMLFRYELLKLENDSLIFNTKRIPSYVFKDDFTLTDEVYNAIEKIRAEGITVTLESVPN